MIRKIFQIGLIALFAVISLPNPAYATGETQVIQVTGHFQTQSLTCPPPDDTEQCVIDQLTGDLIGTNKLVTISFTETPTMISYYDTTTMISQYGEFQGDEHGVIDLQTGEFHSQASFTSTDGCGSILTIHNRGVIDLETLEDDGEYTGTLILRQCE
ncbi:MAG TPA: hypothetical protein VLF20_02940 [Patescibacteria group bacterium]|nr:hypothetical protein [Patescibacteria group bacterium]